MSGHSDPAGVCTERQQLHEAMRQAMAEVHALVKEQFKQAGGPQPQAELNIQLAHARTRERTAVAAYRAHLDTHHCR